MGGRMLELIGAATVVIFGAVLWQPASVPVAGQTAPTQPEAALTPWGEPDLQGIWTSESQIPLQRPARYADREFFTDEERAELDRRRASILAQDLRAHERGSEQDVGGAYSTAIFISHRPTGRRTSLIVDPPDGRIPPLTPEAQQRRDAFPRVSARPPAGYGRLPDQPDPLRGRTVRAAVAEESGAAPVLPGHGRRLGRVLQSLRRSRRTVASRNAACRPPSRRSGGTFVSCSHRARFPSSTTWARDKGGSASSPLRSARICPRAYGSGGAILGAAGKGTPWSSMSRTSARRPISAGRGRTCISSNAGPAWTPRPWSMSRRSTIRRHGHDRGRCRWS